MVGLFQLRPAVFLELYVQIELWRAYLESPRDSADNSPAPDNQDAAGAK
jgi:hypothetical protein